MKETAVLFHGFNVTDQGKDTTDRLRPYLEAAGFHVEENDYGFIFLIGALWGNQDKAEKAADRWGRNAIGIGHSNGCAILWRASMLGAFKRLVLINPALDTHIRFPAHLEAVHVFFTRYDTPTKYAKYIPWVIWGSAGREGCQDRRKRVPAVKERRTRQILTNIVNHDMHSLSVEPYHRIKGHSKVFGKLQYWGPKIAQAAASPI